MIMKNIIVAIIISILIIGCNLQDLKPGDIVPGLGEIILVEKQGPVDDVVAELTWEEMGESSTSVPLVKIAGEMVIPGMLEDTGLISSSGTFTGPIQMLGGRIRIPIATNGIELSVTGTEDFDVSLKPVSDRIYKQLTTSIYGEDGRLITRAPYPPAYSFYTLYIISDVEEVIPEEWAMSFLSSGNIEINWCQAAIIGTDCDSSLYIQEIEAAQGFEIKRNGRIWKQKLFLNLLHGEATDSISAEWEIGPSVRLLAVDPGNAFMANIVTPTPRPITASPTGTILCQNVWVRRVAEEEFAAPSRNFLEPIVKNGRAIWKHGGKSISADMDILESDDISDLILPPVIPEGKQITSWGKIKAPK